MRKRTNFVHPEKIEKLTESQLTLNCRGGDIFYLYGSQNLHTFRHRVFSVGHPLNSYALGPPNHETGEKNSTSAFL